MKKLVISCDSDILELNIKFAASNKDGDEASISITEEGIEEDNLSSVKSNDDTESTPDIDKLYDRISVVDAVAQAERDDIDFKIPDLSNREEAIDDEFASGDF